MSNECRRDSFITHRAFCDALAEENNKASQGLTAMIGANLPGPVSDLMSSIPSNSSISPDFSNDTKNPLKSLSHDLMPMQLKSLNMAGGMFSTTSGTLFGPRSISSASSSLQLSGSSSPSFDGLGGDGKSGRQMAGGTAHMSATALLQKAAQMGATASSNINPPMLQQQHRGGFVAGMAGTDQLSSMRPFGAMPPPPPFDHMQPPAEQSHLVGMDGSDFASQFLQKNAGQDIASQFFDGSGGERAGMNEMGVFSPGIFSEQSHHGFLKCVESESSGGGGGGSMMHGGRGVRFGPGPSGSGSDMMTVDFLGLAGSRSMNLHEQQQQQQQQQQPGMNFETVGQQQQRLHQFQQQQLSHGQAGAMDKHLWDV
ncbi:hypothetical protein ACLOJK_026116 [Asimina triloba]